MALILLLLLGLTSSQSLSPGRIHHPMSAWVNNPIELSVNNLSVASVTATFTFQATTAVTNGHLTITFPAGFNVTGAVCPSNSQTRVGQVVTCAGTDLVAGVNEVDITTVTNPNSAGGYGPFKIVTRQHEKSQILDANYVFGSVGIAADTGTISNLILAYDSNSSGVINLASQKVKFTFSISRDLWKHDMFVIDFSKYFTIQSSVTCTAYATSNEIIYYNNTAGTHALDCKETAQTNNAVTTAAPDYTMQTLYIYGNSNNIDITSTASATDGPLHTGAQNVKLEISGITNPYAKFTGGLLWTVKTQRFQTNTIIEKTSVVATNLTLVKGAIGGSTYESSWGVASTNMAKDMKVFMDASFTIGNSVYDGNTAEVTFSDTINSLDFPKAGNGATIKCWMINATQMASLDYTDCSASTANKIEVTNIAHSQANTMFKFRVLAKLDTALNSPCKIGDVHTYAGANSIDHTSTGLAEFHRGDNNSGAIVN